VVRAKRGRVARSALGHDPDDPDKITVWGDLAALDYAERPERAEIVAYVAGVVRHYLGLGFRGFRCDAAYQVPGDVWAAIVAAARAQSPGTVFAAETLGCTLEDVEQLGIAGFDFLFNSSKWWDFRASWLLEQYEAFRHIAPSIAFPESHDTPRLAAELAGRSDAEIEAEYRFRYLFAAFFSSGVMMPMGFEFGFARKLDVVTTRPSDWEAPRFDLSDFVRDVNAMKAALPVLNGEGAERLVRASASGAVALLRSEDGASGAALAIFNPSEDAPADVDTAPLLDALEGAPREVTPQASDDAPLAFDGRIALRPLEARVFARGERVAAGDTPPEPPQPETAPIVAIEDVRPRVDDGHFPIKRIVGDRVDVSADVFREGHATVEAALLYRAAGDDAWHEAPFALVANDRFAGSFCVEYLAAHEYAVEAWPVGDRSRATRSQTYRVDVERRAARFGAWYELFPRSQGDTPGAHGTLADAARRLPDIRALGFDIVYLPPIHPIGLAFRRGRNNAPIPRPAIRVARGRSEAPRAGTRRSNPPSERSRISTRSWRRRARTISTSRSTTRYRRRPITRTCASIRSGSSRIRTARSSTERIRRRSTATSSSSTGSVRTRRHYGRNCATSRSSGSNAACARYASTIRTRSRSRSGSG
jgi:hypothetical protein